ncbi:hypothetical protein BaRGS_00017027 [Batillaria attramentaria]|uniref:Secreted protein n=1 Tax=Batillaria attramentaria TaxID=370345 RepID=A0ABD0KWU0_9CAEN
MKKVGWQGLFLVKTVACYRVTLARLRQPLRLLERQIDHGAPYSSLLLCHPWPYPHKIVCPRGKAGNSSPPETFAKTIGCRQYSYIISPLFPLPG